MPAIAFLHALNRMTPSRFQVPERVQPSTASQTTSGEPPALSMIFSLLSAENPTNRLFGDQNGARALSVPVSSRVSPDSSDSSQIRLAPSAVSTRKATFRPSGETLTTDADGLRLPPSGGASVN